MNRRSVEANAVQREMPVALFLYANPVAGASPPRKVLAGLSSRLAWILQLFLLILTSHVVLPQDTSGIREPVIAPLAPRSSWIITFEKMTARDAKAKPLNTITVEKDDTTYRLRLSPPHQGISEIWSVNGIAVAINSKRTAAGIVSLAGFPFISFCTTEFENPGWIRTLSFKEDKETKNGKVLVFEGNTPAKIKTTLQNEIEESESLALSLGEKAVAWLEPRSHRPLELLTGDYRMTFSYPPNPGQLVPPKVVSDRLELENNKLKAFSINSSRPRP